MQLKVFCLLQKPHVVYIYYNVYLIGIGGRRWYGMVWSEIGMTAGAR